MTSQERNDLILSIGDNGIYETINGTLEWSFQITGRDSYNSVNLYFTHKTNDSIVKSNEVVFAILYVRALILSAKNKGGKLIVDKNSTTLKLTLVSYDITFMHDDLKVSVPLYKLVSYDRYRQFAGTPSSISATRGHWMGRGLRISKTPRLSDDFHEKMIQSKRNFDTIFDLVKKSLHTKRIKCKEFKLYFNTENMLSTDKQTIIPNFRISYKLTKCSRSNNTEVRDVINKLLPYNPLHEF